MTKMEVRATALLLERFQENLRNQGISIATIELLSAMTRLEDSGKVRQGYLLIPLQGRVILEHDPTVELVPPSMLQYTK